MNNFSKNITGMNRLILMGDNFYDEGIKEKNDELGSDHPLKDLNPASGSSGRPILGTARP